jgi:hypothetical protein
MGIGSPARRRLATAALVVAVFALTAIATPGAFAAGDANMSECPQATEESPGFRTYLPDCMAYEMVSPPFTQGFPVGGSGLGTLNFHVASSGNAVAGVSLGTFAGSPSSFISGNELGMPYLFERSASGWAATSVMPSLDQLPSPTQTDISTDLQTRLWLTGNETAFAEPTAPLRYFRRSPTGQFTEVGPVTPGALHGNAYPDALTGYKGASANLERFAFANFWDVNIPTAEEFWPGDGTSRDSSGWAQSSYEYSAAASEPSLIGVANDTSLSTAANLLGKDHINEAAEQISECGTEVGSAESSGDKFNAVSPSGFGIFFTAKAGPCRFVQEGQVVEEGYGPSVNELYVRVAGTHTIALSEPGAMVPGRDCTGVCLESERVEGGHTRSDATFAGAAEDGHRVYFTTSQPLVNQDSDATEDLYTAELDESGVTKIVDVSVGGEGDPTPGAGAEVLGVVRVAADGTRIYFVAKGVLTNRPNANGESAQDGADNLYVYDAPDGDVAFVAGLAPTDEALWSSWDNREAQASRPSGRFFVFTSRAHPLGTSDTSGDGTDIKQLFRYDTDSGQLVRVSIGQRGQFYCSTTGEIEDGYNCDGNVQQVSAAPKIRVPNYGNTDAPGQAYFGLAVSEAGTVAFESSAALTPQATTGYPNDEHGYPSVYEYKGGNIFLISDGLEVPNGEFHGAPTTATAFVGLTPQEGILFTSGRPLVPQDTNTSMSLYEARPAGGFAAPAVPAECHGEGCRDAPSGPGSSSSPASASFHGPGNLRPRRRTPKCRAHRMTHKHRRTHKRAQRKHPACKVPTPKAKRKDAK